MKTIQKYIFQHKATGDFITVVAPSLIDALSLVSKRYPHPNGLGYKLFSISK
jgi:hypothetical protein